MTMGQLVREQVLKGTFLILFFICMSYVATAAPLSQLLLHEKKSNFVGAELTGVKWHGEELILDENGLNQGEGSIVSAVLKTSFPFNNAVPSWNCIAPPKTGIRVELRAGRGESTWTDWYEISQWGKNISSRGPGIKKSWHGYVDADTLELYQEYDYIQYRVTLLSEDHIQTPRVRRLGIVVVDKFKLGLQNDLKPSKAWGKSLAVPYFSQMVEDPRIAGRICAPTSMTMVLNFFSNNLKTKETADLAYDAFNGIYGNWPYIAAVGELGLKSYVTRFPDWRGVEEQIIKGYPVIISIRFGVNELKKSPIRSSNGHIIVVRGFTEDGQVMCNDPAAYGEDKGQVVYDREELRKAWSNGVAIITEPETKAGINPWYVIGGVAVGVITSFLLWILLNK